MKYVVYIGTKAHVTPETYYNAEVKRIKDQSVLPVLDTIFIEQRSSDRIEVLSLPDDAPIRKFLSD